MKKDLTVIKVGTGVLTKAEDGTLNGAALVRLVTAIAGVMEDGHYCLLVSSGAVGAGVSAFGLTGYPEDLPTRQACAAVGQTRLMHAYDQLFSNFGIKVAQMLLTAADFSTPKRLGHLNATLQRVLQDKLILPIINENDSVAVRELKLGDNDMLSVKIAQLAGAKQLILLTSVDGLMDPSTGKMVERVSDIDQVMSFASGQSGRFSMGGMGSKLQAVKLALESGISPVIANGKRPERLAELIVGGGIGTRFDLREREKVE